MKKMENNARVKIIVTGRQEEESRINYALNKRSILLSILSVIVVCTCY